MNGFYICKDYPEHLRRIRFKDPKSGKTLVFLTNNTTLPPLTIAELYKNRWQVGLFFKWIKQHLRIKKFLGTSENAVKTQICVRRIHLCAHCHRQEGASTQCLAIHIAADSFGLGFRKNTDLFRLPAPRIPRKSIKYRQPIELV